MDISIFSGPTDANEAATATLTLVGNIAMASVAFPEKTTRCSVCKDSSYTAVPFRALGPFSLKNFAFAFPIREAVRRTSNPPVAPETMYTRVPFAWAVSITSL